MPRQCVTIDEQLRRLKEVDADLILLAFRLAGSRQPNAARAWRATPNPLEQEETR